MTEIKIEQKVQLFADEDITDLQSVLIDTDDPLQPWMIISHCGEEISLSVRNWNKLSLMVTRAKSKMKIKSNAKEKEKN